jgi:hypothetical protein
MGKPVHIFQLGASEESSWHISMCRDRCSKLKKASLIFCTPEDSYKLMKIIKRYANFVIFGDIFIIHDSTHTRKISRKSV